MCRVRIQAGRVVRRLLFRLSSIKLDKLLKEGGKLLSLSELQERSSLSKQINVPAKLSGMFCIPVIYHVVPVIYYRIIPVIYFIVLVIYCIVPVIYRIVPVIYHISPAITIITIFLLHVQFILYNVFIVKYK